MRSSPPIAGAPDAAAAASDPGTEAARDRAERAERALGDTLGAPLSLGGTSVRVGTAGWTDKSLTAPGVFYPAGAASAETRLRHYAARYAMVEVDSPYYALPTRAMALHWLERTPDHFQFDVKAFAWMTNHAAEAARLPRELRDALPAAAALRARLYPRDVPAEVRDAAWRLFAEAVRPLHEAKRLGAVFLQYPPWVQAGEQAAAMLDRARARLDDLPIAVEFRHASWFAGAQRAATLALLAERAMSYVIVDGPQGTAASVPPVVAVPAPRLAVIRLHGRRAETWARRGVSVLEKFRYLYAEEEIAGWIPTLVEIAGASEQVHVVFNNCYGNYGTTNALEAQLLLRAAADR